MQRLQDLRIRQFPPITQQKALEIAAQHCNADGGKYKCYSKRPKSCALYGHIPNVPCWYVYAWGDNPFVLRSSRVIVISRLTGEILLDGSARDEG